VLAKPALGKRSLVFSAYSDYRVATINNAGCSPAVHCSAGSAAANRQTAARGLKTKESTIMFKGGMGNIMKQAQAMQEKMQRAQEEIARMEVTGEAGAGMVKVTMLGNHNVRRVSIDDSLMQDDKEMLEDLIAAAINDAVRRVEESSKEKMAGVAGGMQLPPGFKMPF